MAKGKSSEKNSQDVDQERGEFETFWGVESYKVSSSYVTILVIQLKARFKVQVPEIQDLGSKIRISKEKVIRSGKYLGGSWRGESVVQET